MPRKYKKITMIWKFIFWPIVWIAVFIPGFIWPLTLNGFWMITARIVGILLLFYSLFLSSSGGRVLAKFAHSEAHETFWPDRFTEFGIFGCMRHPMHLGLALFPVAVALLSGLVLAISSSGWAVTAALWFVIQIEEKDTIEKYGQSYFEYMQRVPPFSIRLTCLKEALKIWRSN